MNVHIIFLSDNILLGKKVCPSFIEQACTLKGFNVLSKNIFPSFHPDLKEIFQKFPKDLHIIVVENAKARVNETIAQLTSDVLKENVFLKNAVLENYKLRNVPIEKERDEEWVIPSKARGIISVDDFHQGYFLKFEQSYFIVVSLSNFKELFLIAIDEIENTKFRTLSLKTFGLLEENLNKLLEEYVKNKDGIKIYTAIDDLDNDIILRAKEDNLRLNDYVAMIYRKLSKFIYANEDISIYKTAFSLLQAGHKVISIAESITGGNVCAMLIKNNEGASEIIKQSYVTYSDEEKQNILGVSKDTLASKGAVSAEIAYEMANGLLRRTRCDIAVATTGFASGQMAGECFIAVGDKQRIDVYKSIFSGSRKRIIENATKTAFFYIIKKLSRKEFKTF